MKIVLTGGGSAGHVTPNIAIAEQLLARGDEVLYVGSRHPLEADLVQQAGLPLVQIASGSCDDISIGKTLLTHFVLRWAPFKPSWPSGALNQTLSFQKVDLPRCLSWSLAGFVEFRSSLMNLT